MNIDTMTRPRSQGQSKELAPPPVDPFSSSSGMYIPPEEIRQSDAALDEIMGWGLSDFQQDTEEEDDELDDNEFDMDFEDAEYLPPIKLENSTNGVCNKHMSHLNLNEMHYMPYTSPQQASSPLSYPALANREPIEQALGRERAPPVKYINPSSLQLPTNTWMNDSQNSMENSMENSVANSMTGTGSYSGNTTTTTHGSNTSKGMNTGNNTIGTRPSASSRSTFVNTPPSSTSASPTNSPLKGTRRPSNASNSTGNATNMNMNMANFSGSIPANMSSGMPSSTPSTMSTNHTGAVSGNYYPGNYSGNYSGNFSGDMSGNLSDSLPGGLPDLASGLSSQDLSGLAGMDLGLSDIDLDMDIDELYPLPELDLSAASKEPSAPITPAESVITPPAEPIKNVSPKPDLRVQTPQVVSHPSPVEHNVEQSTPPPAPAASTQYRRKTPRRKTVSHRPTASSSSVHHSTAHVCNMTYPDGSECHRSFTRPYDLARHQETLHAAVRKMYTCEVCGDSSKTFSRLDALSRHMRLKHS